MAVPHRTDADVDVEAVVARELVEVTLTVRHEPDPQAVRAERLERGQSVVVEEEVLVPLPLPYEIDGARAREHRVAAHALDDVLREADPELLVVDELRMALKVLERRATRLLVASAVEGQPVPGADPLVPLRAELGPGPEQGEVDVEEDGPEHDSRIRAPTTEARGGTRFPRAKSGCPDLNWGPLRPERSALPGCATPRAGEGYPSARRP